MSSLQRTEGRTAYAAYRKMSSVSGSCASSIMRRISIMTCMVPGAAAWTPCGISSGNTLPAKRTAVCFLWIIRWKPLPILMRYPALLRRRGAGSFCFPTEGSCGKHYPVSFFYGNLNVRTITGPARNPIRPGLLKYQISLEKRLMPCSTL